MVVVVGAVHVGGDGGGGQNRQESTPVEDEAATRLKKVADELVELAKLRVPSIDNTSK